MSSMTSALDLITDVRPVDGRAAKSSGDLPIHKERIEPHSLLRYPQTWDGWDRQSGTIISLPQKQLAGRNNVLRIVCLGRCFAGRMFNLAGIAGEGQKEKEVSKWGVLIAFWMIVAIVSPGQSVTEVLNHPEKYLGPTIASYGMPLYIASVQSGTRSFECDIVAYTSSQRYALEGRDEYTCNNLPAAKQVYWSRESMQSVASMMFFNPQNDQNQKKYVDVMMGAPYKDKKGKDKVNKDTFILISRTSDDTFAEQGPAPASAGGDSGAGVTDKDKQAFMDALKANTKASLESEAAKSAGPATQQELLQKVKDGTASKTVMNSTPSGATLYIDGKEAGKLPMAFFLMKKDKPRTLTVKLEGYEDWSQNVVPDGKDLLFTTTLKPLQAQ
jgi:hypothetical protein